MGRVNWREYLVVLVVGFLAGIVIATTVNC